MHSVRPFGGSWTDQKLSTLQSYLEAYRRIFTKNVNARYFKTIYVDAFAGTGNWENDIVNGRQTSLILGGDEEAQSYAKGSVRVALDLKEPFDEYIFIEKNEDFVGELRTVISDYPELKKRTSVRVGDANVQIKQWLQSVDWHKNRAVVFLDPWGMQVDWETVKMLGATKGVDLWYLFPLGQGVNRLLTKARMPTGGNATRLTIIFGTDKWKDEFYKESNQTDLFGAIQPAYKDTNFSSISQFIVSRLNTIFTEVTKNPLPLRNSKNNPIFLLIFASANEKGSRVALSIANSLLKG